MRQYRQHGRSHQGEESKERRMDEIKDVADSHFRVGGTLGFRTGTRDFILMCLGGCTGCSL